MLACTFGDCRRGQYPAALLRCKFDAPSACCGVVDFITQNPRDIPDGVLGQLGNKIQHALHAYTPAELKGAKTAAQSFRENPEFDTFEVLTSLGIGEALISVLDENGIPTIVKKCSILPPQSQMGALEDEIRRSEITGSLLYTRYSEEFDRDSAYEFLQRKTQEAEREKDRQRNEAAAAKQLWKEAGRQYRRFPGKGNSEHAV